MSDFWELVDETAEELGHDPVELRRYAEKRAEDTSRELNLCLQDLNRRYFKLSIQRSLQQLITEAAESSDAARLANLAREQTLLSQYLSRSFS